MQETAIRSLVGSGRELAEFVPEGFGKRILFSNDRMAAVLAGFRPGQEIAAHAPQIDMVVSVLDGDGRIRIGDEVLALRAGDLAMVPAGEIRAIQAGSVGMVALHLVSPPPTQADHQTGRPDLFWPDSEPEGRSISQAVTAEHAHIRPAVEGLGDLADDITGLDPDERRRRVSEALTFLRDGLLPHAATEEKTIYPAAERVLRARGGAGRTMTLGHERIAALVEDLDEASARDDVGRLPRILHSLCAIVLLHLDEEELVYLPALAGLSPAEARSLIENLGLDAHSQH